MKCINCGSELHDENTTDVTDLENCLIIIRKVQCLKCHECGETEYKAEVVKKIEEIVDNAKNTMNEISVINYSVKVA